MDKQNVGRWSVDDHQQLADGQRIKKTFADDLARAAATKMPRDQPPPSPNIRTQTVCAASAAVAPDCEKSNGTVQHIECDVKR